MTRRLVATVLLTTSLGGALAVVLPASANAQYLCIGTTSQKDPKSGELTCIGPSTGGQAPTDIRLPVGDVHLT